MPLCQSKWMISSSLDFPADEAELGEADDVSLRALDEDLEELADDSEELDDETR